MKTQEPQKVILDTCVLINFLVVDKVSLLAKHPDYRFLVTDHVRGEVTDHHEDQITLLNQALETGDIEQISVSTPEELQAFAELSRNPRLGVGECSAISAASENNLPVALDDKPARKAAKNHDPKIELLSTQDLVVALIKAGLLTFVEADAIKKDWEENHHFRLNFTSFKDHL